MPPKGYKTITVRKEAYNILMNDYKQTPKETLIRKGITSFSGYVSYRLEELVAQKQTPPPPNPQHPPPPST